MQSYSKLFHPPNLYSYFFIKEEGMRNEEWGMRNFCKKIYISDKSVYL